MLRAGASGMVSRYGAGSISIVSVVTSAWFSRCPACFRIPFDTESDAAFGSRFIMQSV